MCVEWGNNLNALLTSVLSFNFVFPLVVKVALERHWLEAPLIFKLIKIFTSPWEVCFVFGCQIDWGLLEIFKAASLLRLLVLALALLILSELVDEDCSS
jgi:hypothetical protein